VETALKETGRKKLAIAGGVAANSRIRADFHRIADKMGVELYLPPLKLCGDNAAMIGAAAYYEYMKGSRASWNLNAVPNLKLGER
jgi:N6-L-threonylcarbamoyladenine synthase